jgi:hypothetical protein
VKNMIAVRALLRVLAPYDVAEAMDYGFDRGEYSGPAHARLRAKAIERVAERFGMDAQDLWSQMAAVAWEYSDRAFAARMQRQK